MPNTTEEKQPRIGVMMVNYNQWDLTEICIRSVFRSENVSIIIGLVDNHSRDGAPGWILEHPDIRFLKNDSNAGVIDGNIKAYELIKDEVDYVILLNNDTEVEPDTMSLLAGKLIDDPGAGLVTPAVTYYERQDLLWHAGGRFIPWKMDMAHLYERVSDLPGEPVEIEIVSACAMMMRTPHYAEIGYQNPDFFIYHEDAEHSIRTMKMGLKNWLVPRARVVHHVSVTTGGVLSPFAVYFTHRNRFLFAARNLAPPQMIAFIAYYFSASLAKTVIYPLKGRFRLVYWMWLAVLHGVFNMPEKRPPALFGKG